jgi:hypothetical protein
LASRWSAPMLGGSYLIARQNPEFQSRRAFECGFAPF